MFWQCVGDTAIGLVQTRTASFEDLRKRSPPSSSGSQVLVGVALALAVGGRVQEGQLLAAALQLQDPTAQVQAAFKFQQSLKTEAQLTRLILFDEGRTLDRLSAQLQLQTRH